MLGEGCCVKCLIVLGGVGGGQSAIRAPVHEYGSSFLYLYNWGGGVNAELKEYIKKRQ
jgi:hypothetical protein